MHTPLSRRDVVCPEELKVGKLNGGLAAVAGAACIVLSELRYLPVHIRHGRRMPHPMFGGYEMVSSNDGCRVSTLPRGRVSAGSGHVTWHAMRGAVPVTQLVVAAILIAAIAFAAWSFLAQSGKLPSIAAITPSAEAPAGSAAAPAAADDLTVEQIYKEARVAMGESRMVSPAGNNALEYYLRILAKHPDDAGATDALRELFPFATGSAEDQINQGNFDEAGRIMGLLAKADPSNYTLTILRSKLDAKKKQNDRDQQQAATAAAAAASRAQVSAAPAGVPAPESSTPPSSVAAPVAEAPATATSRTTIANATPAPAAAPPPEVPAQPVGETRDVRVLTPPRPAYPPVAARNRQDGWVEVEFTVGADGSVQNAKVVGANPTRIFDREAVRAIEQAKFEPRLEKGQAVATTLRRRIEFKLGQ